MALTGRAYPLYAGGGVLPNSGITEGGLYFSKHSGSNEYVVYVAEGTAPSALTRVSTVIGSEPWNDSKITDPIKSGDTIEYSFTKVQGRIKALEETSSSMFEIKGTISSGGTLPTKASRGDAYRFESSGKTSGGEVYEANDWAICTVSSDTKPTWYILQGNVDVAALNEKFNNYALTSHTHSNYAKAFTGVTDTDNKLVFTDSNGNKTSVEVNYAASATTAASAASATTAASATSAKTASVSSKVGSTTANTGSKYQPIYLSSGTPTTCNSYAGAFTSVENASSHVLKFTTLSGEAKTVVVDYANNATYLGDSGNTVGSTSQPVYIKNGKAEKIGYTIQSNVPENAKFSDTTYTNLPNPNILKIQLNSGTTEGTNQFSYSGSTDVTVNITPSSIGAASSIHYHTQYASDTDFSSMRDDYTELLKNCNNFKWGTWS